MFIANRKELEKKFPLQSDDVIQSRIQRITIELENLGYEVDGGDVIGWDICYMIEEMDCYWLDFDNYKTTLEDGLECIIIDTMALSKFE